MQNSSTLHTTPLIIKPYTFPDTVSNPAAVPMIDPELNPPPRRIPKTRFTAEELERLVRLVAEEEPWTKPHGEITKSWNKVLHKLQSEGDRFEWSTVATLQNKVNALLTWQKVLLIMTCENTHQLTYILRIQALGLARRLAET